MSGGRSVAVIGGGLAGLAAAWRLRWLGFAPTVLEAGPAAGGRAACEEREGFALEPLDASLSTADREILAWIDALGLRDELLPLRPIAAARRHRGRASAVDPRGLRGIARLPGVRVREALRLVRLPRLLARYRAQLDPTAPERAAPLDDRSIADFGRLYFGRSVVEGWMGPFGAAAALAEPADASRALFLLELTRHARARRGLPRGSFGEIARAAALQVETRTRVRALGIEHAPGEPVRVRIESDGREAVFEADAAVLATPAPEALRLAGPLLEAAERDALARVRYAPGATLVAALRRPLSALAQEIDALPSQGLALERVRVEPGMPGGRAPDGAGLAVLRPGASACRHLAKLPEETVSKELLGALDRLVPGASRGVLFTRLFRVQKARPRFDVGRYRDLAREHRVETELRRAGRRLYRAGDYRMHPSWNGAVLSGERVAREIAEDLG